MPLTSKEYIDHFIRSKRLRAISFCFDENIREVMGLAERDVLTPAGSDECVNYINLKDKGENASFIDYHSPQEGIHFNLPLKCFHFYCDKEIIMLEKREPHQNATYTVFGLTKEYLLNDLEKQELKQMVQSGFKQLVVGG